MLMFQYPRTMIPYYIMLLHVHRFFSTRILPYQPQVFLIASILLTTKQSVLPTTFLSNKSEFIRKALLNYWDYAYKGQNNILQDYSTNSFRFIVHMYCNQNFWKEFSKCTCTNIYRYVFVCDDQIIHVAHHVLQIHTMPTDFDIPVTVKIINSCCTSNSVSSFSYNHSAGIKARVTSKVWKKNAKYFCSHISLF